MQKMLKNLAILLMFVSVGVLVTSCNKSTKNGIEYIPFQKTKDGRWGMISPDGKVLFEEEFEERPTVVRDGRFFVETKDGFWRMYEATEKPKQIGPDYASVSPFYNGRAVVAEKNKPVSIIDTEGKTVKLLDKIECKTVLEVTKFYDGYALFLTTDKLFGVINTSGKCIIKPQYAFMAYAGDDKFFAFDKNIKELDEESKYKAQLLNSSGKVIYEFAGDKYKSLGLYHHDLGATMTYGKMEVSVKRSGKEVWGIIDSKGEYIVKPSEKYEFISEIHGDKFIYKNDDKFGLANMKGETLIRAKYNSLEYMSDNILLAEEKDGEEYKSKLIDEKDNQIGNDSYLACWSFDDFDGKHTFVKVSDNEWSIIDKKGKELKGLPDMVNVTFYHGYKSIESDYVDMSKVISALNITNQSVLDINFNMSVQQIFSVLNKERGESLEPENYSDRDVLNVYEDVEGVSYRLEIDFPEKIAKRTYKTEYYYGYGYQVPAGYTWNNVKPIIFGIRFSQSGKLKGKTRSVFDALADKFKSMGTVVKQGDNAIIFNLKDGISALVYIGSSELYGSVYAVWGKFKAENIDFDGFNSLDSDETVTEE